MVSPTPPLWTIPHFHHCNAHPRNSHLDRRFLCFTPSLISTTQPEPKSRETTIPHGIPAFISHLPDDHIHVHPPPLPALSAILSTYSTSITELIASQSSQTTPNGADIYRPYVEIGAAPLVRPEGFPHPWPTRQAIYPLDKSGIR